MSVREAHCVHPYVFSQNVRLTWFVWLWLFFFSIFLFLKLGLRVCKWSSLCKIAKQRFWFCFLEFCFEFWWRQKKPIQLAEEAWREEMVPLETKPGWPSGSREIQSNKTKVQPTSRLETCHLMCNWSHMERRFFFPCHYFLDLKRRQTLMLLKGLWHRAGRRELPGSHFSSAPLAPIFIDLWMVQKLLNTVSHNSWPQTN